MNPYFYSGLRHTRAHSRVGHRCALDLDIQNRQPLTIRQPPQQLRDVISRLSGIVGRRGKYLIVFVERISEQIASRTTAQQIHEFVTGDGLHPGRQRLFRGVGMAFVVNRQHQFLQQILDLVR